MSKLALHIIVKDEVGKLDRCLASITPYVDKVYALVTTKNAETVQVLKKYHAEYQVDDNLLHSVTKKEINWLKKFLTWKPEVKVGDKLFFFDKARNKALAMVPREYKYVMWLDADDIFRGGDRLKGLIDRMDRENLTSIFFKYLYEVELDENQKACPSCGQPTNKLRIKNVLIEHLRERIILNDGRYHWVAPIHETLISKTGEVKQVDSKECDVVHLATKEQRDKAIYRNMRMLEMSILQSEGKDPRPIYYLAKAHFDLHTPESHQKAEKLIFAYLTGKYPSGWAEERAQAWEYLAEIYRETGQYNKAIKAGLNALTESNKFPSTYLSLGLSHVQKKEYEQALQYVQLATKVKTPETTLILNPKDMMARALEIVWHVSINTSKMDEAWAAAVSLRDLFPNDKYVQERYAFIDELKQQKELAKVYIALAKHLLQTGEKEKLLPFITATPRLLKNNPIIVDFIKRYLPPKKWSNKSIVIYCGAGWTPWNPKLMKENRNDVFLGGSEEAVVYATRELAKLGYEVTVYGDPGTDGDYDGVKYLSYFKFNPDDSFNILISWRIVDFFRQKYDAKKTYLWLHDVPNQVDYTPQRLENITKIWVLSKAHRDCLPNIPDEKFFITTNGYVEEIPEYQPESNPLRCIWTSSYDRGLNHLLEVWPDVIKAVPDAQLHIFYGWQLFDKFYRDNPERQAWKEKIEKLMQSKGITHHDRVPQKELEKEIKKSGVFAYPSHFYEINCISAIKAQAFGAVPVTTDFAALNQTVRFGTKIKGDIWEKEVKEAYKKALIKQLKEKTQYPEMREWAKKYLWSNVVKSWSKEMSK